MQQGTTRLVLSYGDHLDSHLRIYALNGWEIVKAKVMGMKAGSQARLLNEYVYLTQNTDLETDREGRIVLPQRFREKLQLDEGDLQLLGSGDYIELWKPEQFLEMKGNRIKAQLASFGPGFDPISLADDPGS